MQLLKVLPISLAQKWSTSWQVIDNWAMQKVKFLKKSDFNSMMDLLILEWKNKNTINTIKILANLLHSCGYYKELYD